VTLGIHVPLRGLLGGPLGQQAGGSVGLEGVAWRAVWTGLRRCCGLSAGVSDGVSDGVGLVWESCVAFFWRGFVSRCSGHLRTDGGDVRARACVRAE
jgi:hypothetical protein